MKRQRHEALILNNQGKLLIQHTVSYSIKTPLSYIVRKSVSFF